MNPIVAQWNGEAFVPMRRFMRAIDKECVIGEFYRLTEENERSAQSHRHYFACLNEAWQNLREDMAERFPDAEHLRKYALIRTGFHDERSIVCASKAEAQRVAAFVKPMDTYAVVLVREATVSVFTAKSQSMKAMGKQDFQRSKDAVLEFVAGMVGVKPGELSANAEAA